MKSHQSITKKDTWYVNIVTRPKETTISCVFYIIHQIFMNTEKNQKIWINKIHENLILRGMSEKTFLNYKGCLPRFFN